MLRYKQLTLVEGPMAVAEVTLDPGADYGEVFTRRWVVDLILDVVGYTVEHDLGATTLIEPSCGTGAFVVPIVERLLASARLHGRDVRTLGAAVRAFDLLDGNAALARKGAAHLLMAAGLSDDEADALAAEWITTGDFLLHPHVPASADFVVGNPPYIRLENVPRPVMDAYRLVCPTMRGRADVYVGFIERGLELLKEGGALSFICADRWMRNQYGADLRELITTGYAVETVIAMHDVDAFEDEVSAYPAVVVLRNAAQKDAAVVDATGAFGERDATCLSRWVRHGREPNQSGGAYDATRVNSWFHGRDLWPVGSPAQLSLIADLEARFPPLQDPATGTRVGIGVATGCDEVFITRDANLVESDRLLPLLTGGDIAGGEPEWSGKYLVNPWDDDGLVHLGDHPRLAAYMTKHGDRLRRRHVAMQRPHAWYRTIDRVDPHLTRRPKILLPDMKAAAHPVMDDGGHYPHHNLYFVVSDAWDPEVLGGLLLSEVANLFVGVYCVKMRGGTYRFQAQYLRRIRVPNREAVGRSAARSLATAFRERDVERATAVAASLYGIDPSAFA